MPESTPKGASSAGTGVCMWCQSEKPQTLLRRWDGKWSCRDAIACSKAITARKAD